MLGVAWCGLAFRAGPGWTCHKLLSRLRLSIHAGASLSGWKASQTALGFLEAESKPSEANLDLDTKNM